MAADGSAAWWSAAATTRPTTTTLFYVDPWYGGYQYPVTRRDRLRIRYGPEPDASVRLEVKPKEAEVYVDGYYAGIVDDFDGTFQRLHVAPGEHEIELWLDGYRTVRQKVYLTRGQHLQHQIPDGAPRPPASRRSRSRSRLSRRRRAGSRRCSAAAAEGRGPSPAGSAAAAAAASRRSDARRPRGGPKASAAAGQRGVRHALGQGAARGRRDLDRRRNWRGPGGTGSTHVEVAEGSHTVEIRKAGYRTYVTQVDVRRGQTTPLNVSLRGEQQ